MLDTALNWMGWSRMTTARDAQQSKASNVSVEPFIPSRSGQPDIRDKAIGQRKPGTARMTTYLEGGGIGHASLRLEVDDEVIFSGRYMDADAEDHSLKAQTKEAFIEGIEGGISEDLAGIWLQLITDLPLAFKASKANLVIDKSPPEQPFFAEVSFDIPEKTGRYIANQIKNREAFCDQPRSSDNVDCQYSFIGNNCVDHVQTIFEMTGYTGHFSDYYTSEDLVKAGGAAGVLCATWIDDSG